jgi:Tol biopolymer transport system component
MKWTFALCALLVACNSSTKPTNDLSVASDLAVSVATDLATTGVDGPLPDATGVDGPSPDGAMGPRAILVYVSGRNLDGTDTAPTGVQYSNLWVVNDDGTSIPLTRTKSAAIHSSPTWSPDGKQVAFVSTRALDGSDALNTNSTYNVWVVNADGSGAKALTLLTAPNTSCAHPVWSPDGTHLAFDCPRALGGSDAANGADNIWVMNADGSAQTPLTHLTASSVISNAAVWSPDGSKLAYASNRKLDVSDALNTNNTYNIWVVGANGASDGPVTHFTAAGTSKAHPSWSDDGKTLAFDGAGTLDGSNTAGATLNVWANGLSPSPSPSPSPLTQSTGPAVNVSPAWSPATSQVAFLSTADPAGGSGASAFNVWSVNADGSGLTALTRLAPPSSVGQATPIWSRNGARIAYLSNRNLNGSGPSGSALNVWAMNADGASPVALTRLTAAVSIQSPDWRP